MYNQFENMSPKFNLKNINETKKLFHWRNRAIWVDGQGELKGLYNFKLYSSLSYFSF